MMPFNRIPALVLTALCHTAVVCCVLELKYSLKRSLLYGIFFTAAFAGIGAYGYTEGGGRDLAAYLAVAVCLFLYFCLVSNDSFFKKCFLFITYFCLFTVLDNMLKLAVGLLFPQLSAPAGFYLAIVLRSIILVLILALYRKYVMAFFRSLTDGGGRWWNLALIALLFYALQVSISFLNAWKILSEGQLFLAFAAFSVVMCAVYGIVFSNIRYMKRDSEAALVRQNAAYLESQLSALQGAEAANRRMRHDMRHHIGVVAEYAKTGDTEAILSYLREYSAEIPEAAAKAYSVNRTLNNILSVYAGKTEESGIGFSVRCNAPEELNVKEIDLIAVLGNLLENALHGCKESGKEKQSVEIYIRVQDDKLMIVCNNTCPDTLKLSGSLPAGKSIGISSILSVCKKYDGNLDYKVENNVCSACAVLNL